MEATFAELVALAASLDAQQRRAAEEGLTDDELVLFDLLFKDSISQADRERLKQASPGLLSSLRALPRTMENWTQTTSTQAEVKVFILNSLYNSLPRPRLRTPRPRKSPRVSTTTSGSVVRAATT